MTCGPASDGVCTSLWIASASTIAPPEFGALARRLPRGGDSIQRRSADGDGAAVVVGAEAAAPPVRPDRSRTGHRDRAAEEMPPPVGHRQRRAERSEGVARGARPAVLDLHGLR